MISKENLASRKFFLSTMRPISWLSINFIILSFIALCPSVHNTDNGVVVVKREQDPITKHGKPDRFGYDYTWTDCITRYKANLRSQGFCQCPSEKSTYFYFNDQCNANVDIENLISHAQVCFGGFLEFKHQSRDSPYPVFDLTDTPPSEDVNFKNVKTFHGQCRSIHVFYFDDSRGGLLETTNFVNIFSLKKEKQFVHLDWHPLSESILDGRLIIIEFTNCTIEFWESPASSVSNPCIIFKAQGSLTFSAIDLSTKTAVPSSSTKSPLYSASPSSSIFSGSPHSTLSTPPSTWLKVPTQTQTPSATPSPSPSSTSTLQSTSTVLLGILPIKPTMSPNPTSSKSPEAVKNVSSHTGAIVGSVIAVIAVLLVVVFVVLICRRRKQKTWRRETGTQHSKDDPRSNGSQTSNRNGAEEMCMNTIPDLPNDPANAANISTNVHGNSQKVELQVPELYESMKGDVLQYDYASVNGGPGSNQNKSAEGIIQQRSIPDAFEYDYAAMDGDLRFVNNRTKGMCQHSIPVRRTHNKEDIPTPSNHEPNEYINKKDEPEDGLSSESAYQPLQIKSPEDGVYQSLDKTSRAVNASERR